MPRARPSILCVLVLVVLGSLANLLLLRSSDPATPSPQQEQEALEPSMQHIVLQAVGAILAEAPQLRPLILEVGQAGQVIVGPIQIHLRGLMPLVQETLRQQQISGQRRLALMMITDIIMVMAQDLLPQSILEQSFPAAHFFRWLADAAMCQPL